jgi:hypothetical protein
MPALDAFRRRTQDRSVRRVLTVLIVAGALAAVFATASRAPTSREVIETQLVSFDPHAGPVLKVKVRGGSCSISLSSRDDYLYECSTSGGGDPSAQAIARARPRLRRQGLCVKTIFGLGASAPFIHRCGEPLPEQAAWTPG